MVNEHIIKNAFVLCESSLGCVIYGLSTFSRAFISELKASSWTFDEVVEINEIKNYKLFNEFLEFIIFSYKILENFIFFI